jgi:hypothetical protein
MKYVTDLIFGKNIQLATKIVSVLAKEYNGFK